MIGMEVEGNRPRQPGRRQPGDVGRAQWMTPSPVLVPQAPLAQEGGVLVEAHGAALQVALR